MFAILIYIKHSVYLMVVADLALARKGHGGGFALSRPAAQISVAETKRVLSEAFLVLASRDAADCSDTIAKGLGGLGRVYDEDTANMKAQTRGFRSSIKRAQTLGNYQEVRIRHFHQTLDKYLSAI